MVSVCVGEGVGVRAFISASICIQYSSYPLPRVGMHASACCAVGGWSKRLYVPVTRKVILTGEKIAHKLSTGFFQK